MNIDVIEYKDFPEKLKKIKDSPKIIYSRK